jgi:signal peptidase
MGDKMASTWKDIKWLLNYMLSTIMYAIIVILILVGVVLLVYFLDFTIKGRRLETPLYGAYVIVSGSMEPLIKIQDAVIIKRTDVDSVKVGDVVTYRSTDPSFYGILITHRVINIEDVNGEKIFITKGDHNETIDRTPVKFNQIQGKVVMRVPKIGYIKYFLIDYYGWIIAILVPSAAIISYDIVKLFKNVKNKQEEKSNKKKVVLLEE